MCRALNLCLCGSYLQTLNSALLSALSQASKSSYLEHTSSTTRSLKYTSFVCFVICVMIHWDSLAITGLHITSQEAEQSLFMSRESQDQDNLRLLSALGNFLINKNLSSKLRNWRGRKEAKFPPEAKCKKLWQRSPLLLWPVGGAQRGNWHKMWTGSVITRIFGLMRIRHKHSCESGRNSRDNI